MRNLGGRLLGGVYLPGEVRFLIPNREDSGVIGTGRSDGAVHREEGRKRTGLIQIEIQTGDSSKRSSIGLLYYPRFKAHGLGSSRIHGEVGDRKICKGNGYISKIRLHGKPFEEKRDGKKVWGLVLITT